MSTYLNDRLYPRWAYKFENTYFYVCETYTERVGWAFPLAFLHREELSPFQFSFKGFTGDIIYCSRFTGNCGISTLEFATPSTTPELVKRALFWLRINCKLGMVVASDYEKGYTARCLTNWRKTRGIPNPNMGPIEGEETHNIKLFWKDIHDLDTSEVSTWKAVPIPQPTATSSPQPGIFAGTSGSTIAT